jgi:D-glycero-D-manno-heptose 1,7-bisphosphate phosphatase
MVMKRPYDLVILDRDGVINHDSDAYIKTLEEWIPIEGSIEAIGRLCQAGIQVAVATNQSGLARGYYSADTLEQMHDRLRQLVAEAGGHVAHIAICPHGPDDDCPCRKPRPGMLQEILERVTLVPGARVLMVGDKDVDLEAGLAAGCEVALVKTGKGSKTVTKLPAHATAAVRQAPVHEDLKSLVEALLSVDQGSTMPS